MTRMGLLLLIALLTGVFCAALALVIAALLPPFEGYEVPIVALISGFTGSVFAQLVVGRKK